MFPSLRPGWGWTLAGRAISLALKLPGCLFFLAAMSSGARGLLELKAERGQAGSAGVGGGGWVGDLPEEGRSGGEGTRDVGVASTPGLLPSFWGGLGLSGGGRPLSPVPQGWKWHSPSCFWLGEDRVPYSDARKTCSDYGSTLVTITNRSVVLSLKQAP